MIRFNPDVQLGLVPEIWGALAVAEDVFDKLAQAEVIVTSGREGQHILASLHQVGRAVDIRIKHLPRDLWETIHQALLTRLSQYVILLELAPPDGLADVTRWAPHIHIGYKGVVA